MTYLHQLRAHFESNNNNYLKTPTKSNNNQPTSHSDSLPPKMTSSNKQQQTTVTSKTNTISSPASFSRDTKTPVKSMNNNKNYSNPFDDSDDDNNSNPFSDKQTTPTKSNGIIQINSNGEIVDANESTLKADKQKVTKRDLVKSTPVTSSSRNKVCFLNIITFYYFKSISNYKRNKTVRLLKVKIQTLCHQLRIRTQAKI
jgi:hypothetical protein